MDENLQNIEDGFREAFQNWKADYTPEEMSQGWSHVSKNIPHAPAPHHIPGKTLGWGGGKIIGIAGISAAVITTSVLLYNKTENKAPVKSVQTVQQQHTDMAKQPALDKKPASANTSQQQIAIHAPNRHTSANAGHVGQNTTHHTQAQDNSFASGSMDTKANTGLPEGIVTNKLGQVKTEQSTITLPKTPANNIASNQPAAPKATKVYFLSDTIVCIGEPLNIILSGHQGGVDWGDGIISDLSVTGRHSYAAAGRYSIRLYTGNRYYSQNIEVIQKPVAGFAAYDCSSKKCKFRNQSRQAEAYTWDFGDGSTDNSQHPEHQFTDSGRYLVKLVSRNANGCTDTFARYINVRNYEMPVVPNAITPDGDGKDDEITVSISNESYYHLVITNMKGHTVFESTDKNQHWNGTNNNSGEWLPEGSYYYTLYYKFGEDAPVEKMLGTIHLIR